MTDVLYNQSQINLSSKQLLNQLLQRQRLALPKYDVQIQGQLHAPTMTGTCILPGGEVFTSDGKCTTRKQAEQDAAQQALEYLRKNLSLPTVIEDPENMNYKGILQEICQKNGEPLPRYTTNPVALSLYECSVYVMGKTFKPDRAYRTVKAAQQAAAERAYIELTTENVQNKETSFSGSSNLVPIANLLQAQKPDDAKQSTIQNPKAKLALLHQQLQTNSEGQSVAPLYIVTEEQGPAHGKKWTIELCFTLRGVPYKFHSTHSRKKTAEEDCALQAIKILQDLPQITTQINSNNLKQIPQTTLSIINTPTPNTQTPIPQTANPNKIINFNNKESSIPPTNNIKITYYTPNNNHSTNISLDKIPPSNNNLSSRNYTNNNNLNTNNTISFDKNPPSKNYTNNNSVNSLNSNNNPTTKPLYVNKNEDRASVQQNGHINKTNNPFNNKTGICFFNNNPPSFGHINEDGEYVPSWKSQQQLGYVINPPISTKGELRDVISDFISNAKLPENNVPQKAETNLAKTSGQDKLPLPSHYVPPVKQQSAVPQNKFDNIYRFGIDNADDDEDLSEDSLEELTAPIKKLYLDNDYDNTDDDEEIN